VHNRLAGVRQPTIELQGLPLSGGVSSGPLRILRNAEDRLRIRHGEILLCTVIDREVVALFGIAGAIISEAGGVLANPAIVARECGVPMVSVRGASSLLFDRQHVTVDGVRGLIRAEES
jgi:pyruvate,water dikinase